MSAGSRVLPAHAKAYPDVGDAQRAESVSYTHLEGERMKQEFTGQLIEYDQCRRMAALLRAKGEQAPAVSYTHLDVYKRQP